MEYGTKLQLSNGVKRVMDVAPCGAGKTILFTDISLKARIKGNRTLIVVHRQELLDQTSKTLQSFGASHGLIAAGYPMNPNELIQVASIQTVIRRMNNIYPPQMIIIDECFVAGTMIGTKSIENLTIGETIPCFDEKTREIKLSKVTHLFKKTAPEKLFGIKCNNVNEIVCTGNHPVFTPEGWKTADSLKEGDLVYADMSTMRREHGKKLSKMSSLLPIRHDRKKPLASANKDEYTKSHEERRVQEQNDKNTQKNRSQAIDSWRKRNRSIGSTTNFVGNVRLESFGICCSNETSTRYGVSDSLQDRHCESRFENSNRSRRVFSLRTIKKGTRQKERSFLKITRVDSIKIYKQGSSSEYTKVCPDGYVYNVEVETYGTYIANGVAVHNCHHAAAATWRKLMDAYPDAYVIGFTATPIRMGGQGLGDIFESMIMGPSVKELIAWKKLSPYKYFAPPVEIDMSDLHVKYGDYDQKEIALRMDKSEIIGSQVDQYLKFAPGTKAVCYCVNIAHSQHMAETFRQAGVPAMHIDGDTPKLAREAATNDFKNGKIKVLVNVGLISEGYDVPSMETVICARPTQSLSLHIQQIMRPMRFDKNNPNKIAKIIDAVGNVYRHGLPDEDRDWSLETKKKNPTEKREFQMKICPKCFGVHRPTPVCPYCYHVYQVEQQKEIEQRDGELAEIIELEKKRKKEEVHKARNVVSLEQIAMQRGYRPSWIIKQCELKRIPFGENS